MELIRGIITESYILLTKMAPYLLFGFLFAGLLHIFLRTETISKHLGKNNFLSVIKASLFGVPLPLCSCGVIPAALSLRKEGASKGAVLAFLISTPTTGIDSIFATFALMGGVFALYRVAASFAAGLFVGWLATILLHEGIRSHVPEKKPCCMCSNEKGECRTEGKHSIREKITGVFTYAFGTLLKDSGMWIVLGIIVGGAISYFIPQSFIERYVGSGWRSIMIMFLVGTPMYVCASGSIPIAAALMMKGLNPGAAFAFLLAGPATNTVTMTVVGKELGKGSLLLYLVSIAICSMGFGLLLDILWASLGIPLDYVHTHSHELFSPLLEHGAALFLLMLILIQKKH